MVVRVGRGRIGIQREIRTHCSRTRDNEVYSNLRGVLPQTVGLQDHQDSMIGLQKLIKS